MRTLLCFGDSNTWGYIPGSNGRRFPRDARWPVRLQHALGDEWEVIAEGLNGRTATMDSPVGEGRNGLPYLVLPETDVARSVGRLVKVARSSESGPGGGPPEILVVCPPPFAGHRLGPHFAEMCSELGCALLDLDGVACFVELGDDVEHLDEAGQAAVASAVDVRVRRLLP